MTNPISSDRFSTFHSDAGKPRVEKSTPPSERTVKTEPEQPAGQSTEPTLSRAQQLLAEATPVQSSTLASDTDVRSALDVLKESIAAQPQVAFAAYGGLNAARAEALLSTPTD